MRWSILSCVNHYVLLTKSYWTSLTQYKSCRIHIKQPELSCFGHFRNLQIWSKCKDVRIIWLESFATFKTSFLERRGEREAGQGRREDSSMVRNCQCRKSNRVGSRSIERGEDYCDDCLVITTPWQSPAVLWHICHPHCTAGSKAEETGGSWEMMECGHHCPLLLVCTAQYWITCLNK